MFFKSEENPVARKVLFLDFDGTIALPARKENGEYDIQPDGFIDATHMDKERFAQLVKTAIRNNVPLYFVSGRTESPKCIELLKRFISSVDGFSKGVGGFKEGSIFFASKMIETEDGKVQEEITTKAQIIQNIHTDKYPYLLCKDILFIDDVSDYLDPVTELGYSTYLVQDNFSHFNVAVEFLSAPIKEHKNSNIMSTSAI